MSISAPRLLIVDSRPDRRETWAERLAPCGLPPPVLLEHLSDVPAQLQSSPADLLLIVARPPGDEALALLQSLPQSGGARLPVLIVAESPSLEMATACLRLGAGDYLTEPVDSVDLCAAITRLDANRRLEEERALLQRQFERPYVFDDILGTSPAMQKVFETIARVADSDVDVLVRGETGTGKELVARAIHRRSRREQQPFVPVDCGAIPDNLLESEFFGHERGAFTGADQRRIGLLEFADGGTFFLDEIGELPLLLQAKLLRTLQERKLRRVGGREEVPVNVRIIAATARNLEEMIREKQFRDDLYYRIHVVQIDLPPLRERGDDLGLLAEWFAARFSKEMGRAIAGITPEAYQVLKQYAWPGNIRELQNVIRRGIALSRDSMLGVDDLPDDVVTAAGRTIGLPPAEARGFFALRDEQIARFERDYLTNLLKKHAGSIKTAADEAQVPRGTLYRLMKNHGLDGADYR